MRRLMAFLVIVLLTRIAGAQSSSQSSPAQPSTTTKPATAAPSQPTAIIDTTAGKMTCTLFPDKAPIVLMAHEPDYADEVAKLGRIGLQISGHSHGGQVRLPFVGALVGPYLGTKYSAGLYNINGMALYVNRGVGMIAPLVRFNCPPEITLYTLRAKYA